MKMLIAMAALACVLVLPCHSFALLPSQVALCESNIEEMGVLIDWFDWNNHSEAVSNCSNCEEYNRKVDRGIYLSKALNGCTERGMTIWKREDLQYKDWCHCCEDKEALDPYYAEYNKYFANSDEDIAEMTKMELAQLVIDACTEGWELLPELAKMEEDLSKCFHDGGHTLAGEYFAKAANGTHEQLQATFKGCSKMEGWNE